MAAPTYFLDGSQPVGCIVGTSGTVSINSVNYIVNNFEVSRPTIEAKDFLAKGTPGRRRVTADWATFTAELQLATDSTAYPPFGSTFTAVVDSTNYPGEVWVIDEPVQSQSNSASEIRVARISGKKVVNTITAGT